MPLEGGEQADVCIIEVGMNNTVQGYVSGLVLHQTKAKTH